MNTLNNEMIPAATHATTDAPAVADMTRKTTRIEAYGIKGWKNATWRRTFASAAKLREWCEKHDATMLGTRNAE